MNNSYRLLWNEFTNTWVAVAECARTRGKRASGALLLAATATLALPSITQAAPPNPPAPTQLPTGGQTVAGTAGISSGGASMVINQSTQRAAIDWATFNVGSQAQVRFNQPSAASVTLNRVLDGNPSQIFGRVTANGQVYLSNPSGVYFAPGSSVDVGGLVATTHRIGLDDFMAGKATFQRAGATGSVVNEGELKAQLGGYIALLAPEVRNRGVIIASLGTVALAAGEVFDLQFGANNTLAGIRVEPATVNTLVENGNAVLAPGGLIILSAKAVDRLQGGVIRNSGRLEATGLVERGGRIVLEATDRIENSGSINANAANGSPAGSVSLSAPVVNNSGSITATGNAEFPTSGSIQINAGNLTQTVSGRMDVDAPTQGGSITLAVHDRIELAGRLDASATDTDTDASIAHQGGRIVANAVQIDIIDAQINTNGNRGGHITLDASHAAPDTPSAPVPAPAPGKLALLGATQLNSRGRRNAGGIGGDITLLGDHILLTDTTTLSATGTERGGLVQVGGSFQGGRVQDPNNAQAELFTGRFGVLPRLHNASTTRIDVGSSINVSATGDKGIGGTVIVWSNKTTDMQGSIAARGAASGGAVEISSAALVHSVALKRVDLGKGGTLLLDPQDILIDGSGSDTAGNLSYATNPGTVTHLLDTDVTALLSAGTTVSLQASQDITWLNTFNNLVTRTPSTPGGNLNLSAGRSVKLDGTFSTADGNWTIIANDTAAHGVVNAERGAGNADIDVVNAGFVGSNGKLSLTLADGAGNSNRGVGRIALGSFMGNSLTASIAPTAVADFGSPNILLTNDISVFAAINLTGDLLTSSLSGRVSLTGQSVTWTNEKTGGTIKGEGQIKFIEDHGTTRIDNIYTQNLVTTRIGSLGFSDAVRLELGDAFVAGVTRTYGDSEPSVMDVGTPQLHLAAHSPAPAQPVQLDTILTPGSLFFTGPGVRAPAGQNTLSVSASNTAGFANNFTNGPRNSYFLDLTPSAPIPLTITRRLVTPTVSGASYTYGSPVAVASLANVVNGDNIVPEATLNGTPNIQMTRMLPGFGFYDRAPAGQQSFTVTGLSDLEYIIGVTANRANNYTLDARGAVSGALNIARKPLNYVMRSDNPGAGVYGEDTRLVADFTGIVSGDVINQFGNFSQAGTPVSNNPRLPVGTYTTSVIELDASHKNNYSIAATGNTDGSYVVTPRPVEFEGNPSVNSTYGTLATQSLLVGPPAVDPEGNYYRKAGLFSGDDVQLDTVVSTPQGTLAANTPAGYYNVNYTGLSGAAARNYSFAPRSIPLTIEPKPITYTGSNTSQVYGYGFTDSNLAVTLNGVLASDTFSQLTTVVGRADRTVNTPPVGAYSFYPNTIYGPGASNYILTQTGSTQSVLTITPKPVTLEFSFPNSSTYGTMAVLPQATVVGKVFGSDDVMGSLTQAASRDGAVFLTPTTAAGSHTIGIQKALTGSAASNYMLAGGAYATFQYTVNPKPISATVSPINTNTSIYGDVLPAYKIDLAGILTGDSVSANTRVLDPSTRAVVVGRPNAGTYDVTAAALTGLQAANYELLRYGGPGETASLNVLQRLITVVGIAPSSSVYGTLPVDGVVTFNNLMPGDSASAQITYPGLGTNGNFFGTPTAKSPAGAYSPFVSAVITSDNYRTVPAVYTQGPLTISPKPISFSTPNASSVYGNYPVLGAGTLLGGILPGDDVSAGATLLANGADPNLWAIQNVGSYELAPKLLGQQASNYTLTSVGSTGGTLTVTPAVIASRLELYNGSQRLNPSSYDQANGVLSSRYSSVYGSLASPTVNAAGEPDQKLTARPTFYAVTGSIVGSDLLGMRFSSPLLPLSTSGNYAAGTYSWVPDAVTGKTSNYVVQSMSGTSLTITPAPLAVTPQFQQAGVALSNNSAVYGSTGDITLTASVAAGIKGNNGKQDSVAAPNVFGLQVANSSNIFATYNNQQIGTLPADSYTFIGNGGVPGGALTGADSANYEAKVLNTAFLVKPKEVSIAVAEQRWTYGNLAGSDFQDRQNASITGVLFNDRVNAVLAPYYIDSGKPMNLIPQTPVGKYAINPIGISGEGAGNYFFTPFGQTGYLPTNKSNVLAIAPKSLTVALSDSTPLAITYGDYVTKNPSIVKGLLFSDDVQVTAKASLVVPQGTPDVVKNINGTLLGAGDYSVIGELSGFHSSNYAVTYSGGGNLGTINVAKRALTLPIGLNTLYGSPIPTEFRPGNLVPGENLWVTYGVDELSGARPAPRNANGRYDVGLYAFNRKSIDIGSMANYTLDDRVPFYVVPKELTWVPVANATATYGTVTAIPYATLSGVMANEQDVQVSSNAYRPLAFSTRDVFPPPGYGPEPSTWSPVATRPYIDQNYYDRSGEPRNYYYTDNPDRPALNVGKHNIDVSTNGLLTGSGSSNYRLAASTAEAVVTITPKPLTIDSRQVQYGYYQACESQACSPWGPPLNPNGYTDILNFNSAALQGVVKSDYIPQGGVVNTLSVRASVGYLDANGKSVMIDSKTPLGQYTQVLTGLTGSNASNYVLGAAGVLDVIPLWLSYATTSAIYLNGAGLIGTPGTPSLRGPNGVSSINGDQVFATTVIAIDPTGKSVPNLSNLVDGRYQFVVTALGGKNAGNYRILPYNNNDAFVGYLGRVPYSSNDVGTLDVFANTAFGLNHVGTVPTPVIPPALPPEPSTKDPLTLRTDNQAGTDKTDEVGKATRTSQAGAAVGQGGSAGGGSAQGSAQAAASADSALTFGPGTAKVGATANAGASASASSEGVEGTVGVGVGATGTVGAEGGLGNGTSGNVSLDTSASAGATGEVTGTVKDGQLTVGVNTNAGVGVSVGVSGGVSSGTGSVDAGVGVTSPGSAGVSGSGTAGYNSKDGLTLGMSAGISFGIGGLDLKFKFTIDREKLEGAFAPIINFFGGTAYTKPSDQEVGTAELAAVNLLRTDPYKRLSYLYTHEDWKNAPNDFYLKEATRDLNNFKSLMTAYPDLQAAQKETQATLLRLLTTDPTAAVAFAHSDDFRSRYVQTELAIPQAASALGLKFVVTNGTMSLENR